MFHSPILVGFTKYCVSYVFTMGKHRLHSVSPTIYVHVFHSMHHVESNMLRYFSSMAFVPQMHNKKSLILLIIFIMNFGLHYTTWYIMTADLMVTVEPSY